MSLKKVFFIITGLFFIVFPLFLQAEENIFVTDYFDKAFRNFKDIPLPSIKIPTVVEVSFDNEFLERFEFAVFDATAAKQVEHLFIRGSSQEEVPIKIQTNGRTTNGNSLNDGNSLTYIEFPIESSSLGEGAVVGKIANINISSDEPITSSLVRLILSNNVALPTHIEIRADGELIVVNQKMTSATVRFPKTTAKNWAISFWHVQPLRISELHLTQEFSEQKIIQKIRFLAQPSHTYRIYFNPDRTPPVTSLLRESDLKDNKGVVKLQSYSTQKNPTYTLADIDKDGIADINDNCVNTSNQDQEDIDENGRGDACDDFDRDGFINSLDIPNRNQADEDADTIGDACDEEESRLTERHTWIPWAGIGIAGAVLLVLFTITARGMKKDGENNTLST